MRYKCIRYERGGAVATIYLSRSDVLNAMNRQMWLELERALAEAQQDPEVKVLIFTGDGRAFSSGADLKESKQRSIDTYRTYLEKLQSISKTVLRFEKPTLAAINGYAIGSGAELALACDVRLAASEAQIGLPEAKVTSSVTGGAFRLIQDLIGPGKAKELLFTGDYISGQEAEKIGLVNKAVPLEDLIAETQKMAHKIAANAAISLKMIKRGLALAQGETSLEALMDYEIEACLACVSSKQRQQSLKDFEQRKTTSSHGTR
jgi:enoyl-CoA hydratase